MWYVYDGLYVVFYVRVTCFVVRGCVVSRRYIHVCDSDVFSVGNMYLDHLKFYVVCINGRRYVCCSECYVVSNECDEPTSSTAPTYAPHCHPWICGQTPPERLHCWLVDHKREHLTPPTSKGHGSG